MKIILLCSTSDTVCSDFLVTLSQNPAGQGNRSSRSPYDKEKIFYSFIHIENTTVHHILRAKKTLFTFCSFANLTPFCQTESPSLCKSFKQIAKKVEVLILSGKFGKKLKSFNVEQSLYYIADGNHKVTLLSYRWTSSPQ